MAIEGVVYLTYAEAVALHIELMRFVGETRYGVFDRTLVESALSRPRQAAVYDDADISIQAATLCFGLIKNHPWHGGNKRTATFLTDRFLRTNGYRISARAAEFIGMVLAVEAGKWTIEQVADWMRAHIRETTDAA